MSTDRIRCTAEGCVNTILPETAKRTGGVCMRCENKRLQAERAEFIRKNRREVDPYAGLTDPVEIIREMHQKRAYDPLIIYKEPSRPKTTLYAGLNLAELDRVASIAINAKQTGNDDSADEIARELAAFTTYDTSELAQAWLNQGDCWPAVIFRGANTSVRDAVIRILRSYETDGNTAPALGHELCALAWIGDQEAQQCFVTWAKRPPVWQSSLHVETNRYTQVAGWEIENGKRRDLVHPNCYSLTATKSPESAARTVRAFQPAQDACPGCQRGLVYMLEIDAGDPRFAFLNASIPQLRVLTCEVCMFFNEHLFAKISDEGIPRWHPSNKLPTPAQEGEFDRSPWAGVEFSIEPRPPMQAVEWMNEVSASQIGGHPTWVQDDAYPQCPDCGRTMMFVAQLDNGDFKSEGIIYAFHCSQCRVTATGYQQS
jgi:hypothetical protein